MVILRKCEKYKQGGVIVIRVVFRPTFGNISDWECSHCGLIWESGHFPKKCPNCQFEEMLKVLGRTWAHSARAACAKKN
jgi:rubrerythrin